MDPFQVKIPQEMQYTLMAMGEAGLLQAGVANVHRVNISKLASRVMQLKDMVAQAKELDAQEEQEQEGTVLGRTKGKELTAEEQLEKLKRKEKERLKEKMKRRMKRKLQRKQERTTSVVAPSDAPRISQQEQAQVPPERASKGLSMATLGQGTKRKAPDTVRKNDALEGPSEKRQLIGSQHQTAPAFDPIARINELDKNSMAKQKMSQGK
jgi:hypothetical protein